MREIYFLFWWYYWSLVHKTKKNKIKKEGIIGLSLIGLLWLWLSFLSIAESWDFMWWASNYELVHREGMMHSHKYLGFIICLNLREFEQWVVKNHLWDLFNWISSLAAQFLLSHASFISDLSQSFARILLNLDKEFKKISIHSSLLICYGSVQCLLKALSPLSREVLFLYLSSFFSFFFSSNKSLDPLQLLIWKNKKLNERCLLSIISQLCPKKKKIISIPILCLSFSYSSSLSISSSSAKSSIFAKLHVSR